MMFKEVNWEEKGGERAKGGEEMRERGRKRRTKKVVLRVGLEDMWIRCCHIRNNRRMGECEKKKKEEDLLGREREQQRGERRCEALKGQERWQTRHCCLCGV